MSIAREAPFTLSAAGFWIRAVAALIDFVLVYIASIVAWIVVGDRYVEVAFCIIWLAYSSFEIWTAQTLGKLIFGLTIRLADEAPADRATLFLRWTTKQSGIALTTVGVVLGNAGFRYLGGICNLVICIGFLRVLGEEKRAWHDLWARTAVYRKKRASPQAAFEPVLPAQADQAQTRDG